MPTMQYLLVKGGFLQSLGHLLLPKCCTWKPARWEDGSLTVQDPLWMMIGATVGLLWLKLCTERGLLPLAALPLTQGCHVETLQPKGGGGGLIITYTYEQIPSEDPHTHRHVAPTHKQSEQKQTTSCLFSFSSLSFSQTLVDRWKGDDGPVYSGISWSRRCHNNVKHHILSIHTDSNQTTLSHKSLIQYHKWYQ